MDFNKLFIEQALFPAMELLKGNRIRPYLKELTRSASLAPEALAALQKERLKTLLLHCIDHVPAYRDLAFLRPDILRDARAALLSFPVLSKADFRRDPSRYLADTAEKAALIENRTGGSTGEPVVFFMDRVTVEHYEAARWRGLSWWNITPGSRSVMIWGHPLELKQHEQEAFRQKERRMKNRIAISAYALYEKDMPGHVETIRAYKPEYLYGFATALYTFARLMLAQKLSLPFAPKAVVSTSETLFPHYREVIEEAFRCPVVNEYGARDGGIIAYEAPCGQMHITAENGVYEILDPLSRQPVPAGTRGLVAVTDLHNFSQPRLRYLPGDMASVTDKPCACGRGLPVMESIDGREDCLFRDATGKLFYGDIYNRFAKMLAPDAVSQFQITQFGPLEAELLVVWLPGAPRDQTEAFLAEVKNTLPGAELRVKTVDEIPKTASGKTLYAIRKFEL